MGRRGASSWIALDPSLPRAASASAAAAASTRSSWGRARGAVGARDGDVKALRGRAVVGSFAALGWLAPSSAHADEGVDVTWSAPEGCPSSADLQRRVTARLPDDATVHARGRVEKRGGRYRLALDIATSSSRGERALEASTCEALASSAAVVIAMSVAPASARDDEAAAAAAASMTTTATEATATNSGAAVPAPPPAPASAPPVTPAPDRGATPPRRSGEREARFSIRAHVAGDAGLLPAAAVGGGLALGVVVLRDLSLEAGADFYASQDATVSGSPGRGASFQLLAASARACWTLTHGIEVAPCAGVEVVRIAGSGFGAVKVADAESLTWGPEAVLTARLPVAGPLSLRLGLGGFVPMSRQSFVINASGTVHQPGAVALRTWLGPEVRF